MNLLSNISVGRVDDVIILASGEKTVPAPMEDVIISSALVGGVVMFGRERNQVGVLIEPRADVDTEDLAAFRNKIWWVNVTTLYHGVQELMLLKAYNRGSQQDFPFI